MDDVTASIIVACQTKGAQQAISKLGFAFSMLGREAWNFAKESVSVFSDLQEETQKFGVVFQGVNKQASGIVDELIAKYGQSELSAKRMLAQTGDLLSGFGFGRKQSLEMAEAVAKLGSDLASFSNYEGGAEKAAYALTKAMLGETEQAKMLGIAIKTDTPEYRNMVKEIQKANGVSVIQARAMAALKIAYSQSGNAIGDFERSIGSIANQGRVLDNRFIELKTTIGGLIDSFMNIGSIKGGIADVVKSVSDYIKENTQEWAYWASTVINLVRGGFELIWTITKTTIDNIAVILVYAWDVAVQAWKDAPGFFGAVWEDIKITADNTWNFITIKIVSEFEMLGSILRSFGRNWWSIFKDIADIAWRSIKSIGVVFVEEIKNIGKVAWSLGKNFWDLVTGKKSFSEALGNFIDDYANVVYETSKKVSKQWEGFEFGAGTKQFGDDVANAMVKYAENVADAGGKIISDIGKNTAEYLKKNGIQLGEFTRYMDGINKVTDDWNKRQKEIDARRGYKPEDAVDKPAKNKQAISEIASIAQEVMSFRQTSQSAIMANSLEAMRLQSRKFGGTDTQKQIADNGKKQVGLLERIDRTMQNIERKNGFVTATV